MDKNLLLEYVIAKSTISKTSKIIFIYFVLKEREIKRGISYTEIEEKIMCSRTQAITSIKELIKKGLIRIVDTNKRKNIYEILDPNFEIKQSIAG